jgi:4'-phosphopantetheinyl transferase
MSVLVPTRDCTTPPWSRNPAGDVRVEIRLVDLSADDDAVARAELCLSPAELARARKGSPAVHRRRVLLRTALREALGTELDVPAARVPLATTELGRPYICAPVGGTLLDVSCSASGGLGVVAVARGGRIGIDLETVARWSPDVLDEGWLSDSERRALTRLPASARPVAVTRSWTQKEAVLKARGTGLSDDPATAVTTVGRADGVVAGWRVRDVPVPPAWIASLAVSPEREIPA